MAKVCTMHLLTRLERAITLASESFIALKLINSSVGKLGFVIRAFDGHPSAENFLVFHYASFFFCALEKHLFISGNRLFVDSHVGQRLKITFKDSPNRKKSISDSNHVLNKRNRNRSWYLRTKRLLIRVAGTQKTITSTSAMARLAINRLVTVRIRGTRNTTEMTNRLPTRPTLNTSVYAMQ